MLTKINSIGNIIQCYQNGNYHIIILNDGTKIRYTEEEKWRPLFPESIDVKITNKCDLKCPYCHESSTIDGEHCDMNKTIEVLNDLPAGVELAIGGGNPLEHPELFPFLEWCKSRHLICNITINSDHFKKMNHISKILSNKLIYGLGISYSNETFRVAPHYKNTVCHVILGIHSLNEIENALSLYGKILILGYKDFGRGQIYKHSLSSKIDNIKNNLWKLFQMDGIISFDNLAIKQLQLENYFYEYAWKEFYMGNDGDFTMYYDAVEQKFGKNSCTKNTERESSDYGIIKFFNSLKLFEEEKK